MGANACFGISLPFIIADQIVRILRENNPKDHLRIPLSFKHSTSIAPEILKFSIRL